MPRYYDIDVLAKMASSKADTLMPDGKSAFLSIVKWLDLLPAADVAPRVEVAREIFEEIENIAKTVAYPEALVNGMIISHQLEGLYLDEKDFSNLKNKYLEVSK